MVAPNSWRELYNVMFLLFLPLVRASDKRIACDEEFSDSEDEGDGRKHRENYKVRIKRARKESTEKREDDKSTKGQILTGISTK